MNLREHQTKVTHGDFAEAEAASAIDLEARREAYEVAAPSGRALDHRDHAAERRELAARRRDEAAEERDQFAAIEDQCTARRDEAARLRDQEADRRDAEARSIETLTAMSVPSRRRRPPPPRHRHAGQQ